MTATNMCSNFGGFRCRPPKGLKALQRSTAMMIVLQMRHLSDWNAVQLIITHCFSEAGERIVLSVIIREYARSTYISLITF